MLIGKDIFHHHLCLNFTLKLLISGITHLRGNNRFELPSLSEIALKICIHKSLALSSAH
jgi:hypothetical protein